MENCDFSYWCATNHVANQQENSFIFFPINNSCVCGLAQICSKMLIASTERNIVPKQSYWNQWCLVESISHWLLPKLTIILVDNSIFQNKMVSSILLVKKYLSSYRKSSFLALPLFGGKIFYKASLFVQFDTSKTGYKKKYPSVWPSINQNSDILWSKNFNKRSFQYLIFFWFYCLTWKVFLDNKKMRLTIMFIIVGILFAIISGVSNRSIKYRRYRPAYLKTSYRRPRNYARAVPVSSNRRT